MKKSIIILFITITCAHIKAQNPPVIEKAAPQSNNTLSSGGTLGSNSGVNPMGNPGTIANSSSSGSGVNSGLAPHPNAEPGVFLSSSPEGTVITTTITNNGVATQQATTITNAGTNTAVVSEPAKTPVAAVPVVTATVKQPVVKPEVKEKPLVAAKAKPLPAYTPVLGNYVSEQTVNKIKSKYGDGVYDIRTIRIASTNKIAYMVRLLEDGKLRTELYYEQ